MKEEAEEVLGLQVLLQQAAEFRARKGDPWQFITVLDTHPFGLASQLERLEDCFTERFCYVGEPGYTDVSIEWMAAHLLHRLEALPVQYLRVILGQLHPEDFHDLRQRHDVYFEIGFSTGEVLISGGTNDFSGEGGRGKATMDHIFAFLAYHFGLQVETVRLQISPAATGKQYIADCYNAAHPVT